VGYVLTGAKPVRQYAFLDKWQKQAENMGKNQENLPLGVVRRVVLLYNLYE
jgi:hypothetical protein